MNKLYEPGSNKSPADMMASDEVSAVEAENIVRDQLGVQRRDKYEGTNVAGFGLAPSGYVGFDVLTSKSDYATPVEPSTFKTPLNLTRSTLGAYRFRGKPLSTYMDNLDTKSSWHLNNR